MLESVKDPFNVPWWSADSSVNTSPRRNSISTFGRSNGTLKSRLMESDDSSNELELALEGARKKLTWISREEHKISAQNSVGSASIQNGFVHGRSSRFSDSPGRNIQIPSELSPLPLPIPPAQPRSSRFGGSDSPGRGNQIPSEMSALQSTSAQVRSSRFGVPDSPARGAHIPSELQNGSALGRSGRFGVPDSPARGTNIPSELSTLQNGSALGRSGRFGVPDSPARGIPLPSDDSAYQTDSAQAGSIRFGVPDSPARGIPIPSDMSALLFGSAPGRTARFGDSPARFGVPDSPARFGDSPARFGVPDIPARFGDSPARFGDSPARFGDSPARFGDSPARFGVPDSPARFGVPDSPARFGVPDSPARFGVPDSPARFGDNPARFGVPDSPARFGDNPARFGVPDSPARFGVPDSPAKFPDSPARGIQRPSELSALHINSMQGRSARFGVSDSPAREIQTPSELSSHQNGSAQGRSARFGVLDSPAREIHTPSELPSLQKGSAQGRSARFGALDSPARETQTPSELSSLQNGFAQGRSARFGTLDSPARRLQTPSEVSALQNGSAAPVRSARFGVPDSPARGMYFPPESPARRGESVRQIRTPSPSMDTEMTDVLSNTTPTDSRRLRSSKHDPPSPSFQEGDHTVTKNDFTVVREASAIRRISTSRAARDQGTPPRPQIQPATTDSSRFTPIPDTPESDELVVSYLAEETERIIKGRFRKLNLRDPNSNAGDQIRTTDSERPSAGEEVRNHVPNVFLKNPRNHGSNSFRQIDQTNAARVDSRDQHRDNGGGVEHRESAVFHPTYRPGTLPRPPGSPHPSSTIAQANGPPRTITATMENYLENRKRDSNMGTQITITTKPSPGHAASPTASHPSLSALRQASQPENPSTSSKNGVGRYDTFNASGRAALSPLNGNEDVTHSPMSLSQCKEEHGEDLNRGRRKESNESVPVEGENGFPSRSQYWADFLGKREVDSNVTLSHLIHETDEEVTSPSERKGLGVRLHSNRARGQPSQDKRQLDSYGRNVAGTGVHSQRYDDVGRSLLSEKGFGSSRRGSSRRTQSCRRDSIIHPFLETSAKNEAFASSRMVLPSGLDTSGSDSKSSRRYSVDMQLSSSSETIHEQSSFLAQSEKTKFLFKASPKNRKNSRRSSAPAPDSGESLSESTASGSGDSVQDPSQLPTQNIKPGRNQRTSSQAQTGAPHKDSLSSDSKSKEKKKNGLKLQLPRMLHHTSLSMDEDNLYKGLFVKTKSEKKSGQQDSSSSSTSARVAQACLSKSPKTPKSHPASPRGSLQRWIANQFRGRSSSTGNFRETQQEEKVRKSKSPWRTRPAEFFQVITRKKGSSARAQAPPLLDAHGLQNLRQQNLSEAEAQAQTNRPEPWHRRMKDLEGLGNSASLTRHTYFLPIVANPSPLRSRGLQSLFRKTS